jgi:hypothetical protein
MISTAQDYINQVQRNIHDTTNADFSNGQILGMVNEARQRVALDTHCYRQFITGLNTVAQQETYLYNGSLGGVQMVSGGMNYSSPMISFTGGSGSGAAAEALVENGVITNINMTNWGSGYSTSAPPTVVITDGTGTGASANPVILFNVLDILSISVLWGTLRTSFGWLPFSAFQAFCRAYTNQYETPGVFTMYQAAFKAYVYPIPDQVYPMEMDVITLPTDLAGVSTAETQILAPWNDAVQFYASFLAIASLQQYEKARFWYDAKPDGSIGGMYGGRIKQLPATAFSRRIPNSYRTFYPLIRKLMGY